MKTDAWSALASSLRLEREIPKREDGWICVEDFAAEAGKRITRSRQILAELALSGAAEKRAVIVGKTSKNYYRLTPSAKPRK